MAIETFTQNDKDLADQEGKWRAELLARTGAAGAAASPPDPAAPAAGYAVPLVRRVTGVSTIATGAIYAKVVNAGAADGLVGGAVLKTTEEVAFPTGYGMVLPVIAIDGTGTDLLVTSIHPPA